METLHICKYLGRNGTWVIVMKWMMDIVRMVLFKYVQKETNYVEGKHYFAVEKMSAVLIGRNNGEDIDDNKEGSRE
jgi:hypothetical protein